MVASPNTYRPIVLLAGQDALFAAQLAAALEQRSAELVHCTKGAVIAAEQRLSPDVLVLGLGDGNLETVRHLRAMNSTPILVIGPDGDSEAVSTILDAGADDYVRDSRTAAEVTSRVCVLLRRPSDSDHPLQVGALVVHRQQRDATINGQSLHLTQTEYRLIEALARQPGRVLFHQDLIDHVWATTEIDTHSLAVVVCRLRQKLRDVPGIVLETISGVGYRLHEGPAVPLDDEESVGRLQARNN